VACDDAPLPSPNRGEEKRGDGVISELKGGGGGGANDELD